jgi:alanine-synthesizing transaminase
MFADRTNWNLEANRLSAALARHRAEGKSLLDLTVSNPTECGFAYNDEAILRALSQSEALEYHPDPRGLPSARLAIAAYYRERGENISPEDLILATSTSEAYSFLFRLLCNPGDDVLVPSPSYPLFEFLADVQDVNLSRYPLVYDHGWQIDFPALERTITPRTRAIIVVHPNNPTGHFVSSAGREKLCGICSSRQIALIADEVFLDFDLAHKNPRSFAANSCALTFSLSGLSKICGLPQMKVSWMVCSGPEALKSQALARLEVISDSYLSMNTPIQLAIAAMLEQRRGFQQQLLERARANLSELDAQLCGQKSCSRLAAEGGWNVILRVPATRPDEDLAIDLLAAEGVYVHPGHFYNFPHEGRLVLSLLTEKENFSEGVRRLLSFCE